MARALVAGAALAFLIIEAAGGVISSPRSSAPAPNACDTHTSIPRPARPPAQLTDCDPPRIVTVFDLVGPEQIGDTWQQIADDSLGYELIEVSAQEAPPTDSLELGDVVVWTTGLDTLESPGDVSCLTAAEEETLLAYLLDPSPGVTPALYLDSPDSLDEQLGDEAVSPLATALGIDDVDTTDYSRDELLLNTCGERWHFKVGFHRPALRQYNQADDYRVLGSVGTPFRAVDPDTERIPGHLWNQGSYSVLFTTFLLASNSEPGDPGDYPQDSVTWVRLALTELGHPPRFHLGPTWADTTLSAPQGGIVSFDAVISNCMNAAYRDRTPGLDTGFGLHAAITDTLGVVLHQFKKMSLAMPADDDTVVARALEMPSFLEPGSYVLVEELGYLPGRDHLKRRRGRLEIVP